MTSFFECSSRENGGPRIGKMILPGGEVPTPVCFMPVGTQATVKGLLPVDLREVVHAPIILGNTYHLNLRPGVEVIKDAGGLSRFMKLNGPVLTDSGGFQVFSLSKLRKVSDEGVCFKSHLYGKEIFLGPKEAISIQDGLRSDIAMCLDECPKAEASREEVEVAVKRTTLWAGRCMDFWKKGEGQADGRKLFGIAQGGRFKRFGAIWSADELTKLDFPGYAVGGVSVGETEEEMLSKSSGPSVAFRKKKPRYVMGVGLPLNFSK